MNHRSRAVTGGSWRVAVGGNRVQNMTPEEIARAFRAGQLNERTPLWPPGTSGWQALGNFEQFRIAPTSMPPSAANPMAPGNPYSAGQSPNSGGYGGPVGSQQGPGNQPQGSMGLASTMAGVGQLSSYDEEEDDPTRMWTGDDPAMMPPAAAQAGPPPSSAMARPADQAPYAPGGTARQPVAPSPAVPPQPTAGAHSVPQQPPAPAAPPPQPAMRAPVAPAATSVGSVPNRSAQANVAFRPPEERRGGGMTLVVGVVGLGLLGAAIFALKGGDDSAKTTAQGDTVATAPMAVKPADKKKASADKKDKAEPGPTVEASDLKEASPSQGDDESPEAKALGAKTAERQAIADTTDEQQAKSKDSETGAGDSEDAEAADDGPSSAELSAKEKRKARRIAARKLRLANEKKRKRRRARAAAAEEKDTSPRAAPTPAKVSSRRASPSRASSPKANATVQKNASKALETSSKLARSCRPKGGPSGPGKVRVTYNQDGSVKGVEMLTARFRETLTGGCVRMVFRRAKIKPFKGTAPPFIKGFTIPDQ